MAVEERRAPLTERQVEQMMSVFLRRSSAFEAARRQLTPDRFATHHKGFAAVWTVACDYFDEFNDLPGEESLMGELERRFEEDPEALSDEEVENLDGFIARAYAAADRQLTKKIDRVAFKYLRVYLEDRIADRIRADLTSSTYSPGDLCGMLTDYQLEISQARSLEPTGLSQPFPAGWELTQKAVIKSITGLQFLDDMLNGGQAEKEVYGVLGPHGSCKTTIGIQYGTIQAKLLRKQWVASNKEGVLKTVYMFIYESDIDEMRLRALSSLGIIDRNVLEAGDWSAMGTRENRPAYERKMFRRAFQQGLVVPGEGERWRTTQKVLNTNWRCIDMTGNDPDSPGRGWGLVDEISQIIQMDQDYQESQGIVAGVGPIIIDYAGAAVKRYLDHHGKDYSSEIRHLISSFPMQCKNKLAIKYRTTVIALHQLTGAANAISSGTLPKSTDAAEAKNWRENLDFSFIVGNPNSDNRAAFGCDKHRRAGGVANVVIEIQGEFCRVVHDPTMAIDHIQRKIVPKDQLRTLGEVDDDSDDRPDHHEAEPTETAASSVAAETGTIRSPRTSTMGPRRGEGRG